MASEPESATYWLHTWLESHKVSTVQRAASLLCDQTVFNELRDAAINWTGVAEGFASECNLVAGTGLRLDDRLTCPNPLCRRRQVDVLFRHAWHYFDRIFLPDGVGSLLRDPPESWTSEYLLHEVLSLIDVVLHIRQIGASPLVHYYLAENISSSRGDANPIDARIKHWDEAWNSIEEKLLNPENYVIKRIVGNQFEIIHSDPEMGIQIGSKIEIDENEADPMQALRQHVAHSIMHRHMVELEQDLTSAERLKGALASTVWSHERVLTHLSEGIDTSRVLFSLTFPSLANVPIKELMSIRLNEKDAFIACRSALRKTVQEIAANRASSDPQTLATEILKDVIEPELARLRLRLHAAQKLLLKKSAISFGIAGVSTVCGLHMGASPTTALSAGSLALFLSGFGGAASKYSEEKRDLDVSDMFFLWKAMECGT